MHLSSTHLVLGNTPLAQGYLPHRHALPHFLGIGHGCVFMLFSSLFAKAFNATSRIERVADAHIHMVPANEFPTHNAHIHVRPMQGLSNGRDKAHKSARPAAIMLLTWSASVIAPTAITGIPASLRIRSAIGVAHPAIDRLLLR